MTTGEEQEVPVLDEKTFETREDFRSSGDTAPVLLPQNPFSSSSSIALSSDSIWPSEASTYGEERIEAMCPKCLEQVTGRMYFPLDAPPKHEHIHPISTIDAIRPHKMAAQPENIRKKDILRAQKRRSWLRWRTHKLRDAEIACRKPGRMERYLLGKNQKSFEAYLQAAEAIEYRWRCNSGEASNSWVKRCFAHLKLLCSDVDRDDLSISWEYLFGAQDRTRIPQRDTWTCKVSIDGLVASEISGGECLIPKWPHGKLIWEETRELEERSTGAGTFKY